MVLMNIPSRSINLSARLRYPLIKFRHGPSRDQHQTPSAVAPGVAGASKGQTRQAQAQQASIYDFELPLRFRRKPLSEEEIEFINRGGPA